MYGRLQIIMRIELVVLGVNRDGPIRISFHKCFVSCCVCLYGMHFFRINLSLFDFAHMICSYQFLYWGCYIIYIDIAYVLGYDSHDSY